MLRPSIVWTIAIAAGCTDQPWAAKDTGCQTPWYADTDGDGHGDPTVTQRACEEPEGWVSEGDDCDDSNPAAYPGGTEVCSGADEDCDGEIDEGVGSAYYPDADGDGFGADVDPLVSCDEPKGAAPVAGDCDDGAPTVNPDGVETCNGVDDDCNGIIDDDVTKGLSEWWYDGDFDGFGDPSLSVFACDPPEGYVDNPDDCDDNSAAAYPGAIDNCNGIDDDCDGEIDEDAMAGWWMITADTEAGYVLRVDLGDASTNFVSSVSTGPDINTTDVREDGLSVAQDYLTRTFYTLDACTGSLTPLGPTNSGGMCGIAFGGGGLLYGLDYENDVLMEFNIDTGKTREVGSLGFDLGLCGLSYDCTTGRLIGANSTTSEIFEVDVLTGKASNFIPTDVAFSQVGVEYDPRDRTVYVSTRDELYSVDPITGATTFLGYVNGSIVDDLTLHPHCGK